MAEKIFASGCYFDRREQAPDWVVGRISINVDKFVEWLSEQDRSEKGYVNLNVHRKRDGSSYYVELDTWRPDTNRQPEVNEYAEAKGRVAVPDLNDDIPF